MHTKKPYIYIIIRKDLEKRSYAPQIAHAALEAGYAFDRPSITTHLVVLEVKDELELEMVRSALAEESIDFVSFIEGYKDIGLTSVATEILNKIDSGVLSTLKLFKY